MKNLIWFPPESITLKDIASSGILKSPKLAEEENTASQELTMLIDKWNQKVLKFLHADHGEHINWQMPLNFFKALTTHW